MGEQLVAAVAAALPDVVSAIPPAPAAALGRLGSRGPVVRRSQVPEPPVVAALRAVEPWVVERVHGALEGPLARLRLPDLGLTGGLAPPPSGAFATLHAGSEPEALRETRLLARTRPGLLELVAATSAGLPAEALLGPLRVGGDEEALAAAHGAGHLALAVITSALALRELGQGTAAVVGTALGVATERLRSAPVPPGYADAVVARRRAEYRLPQAGSDTVAVRDHAFALAEGAFPVGADFTANGLVDVVPGGVVVRTGGERGTLAVGFRVLAGPPDEVDTAEWDEVVDVSWTATRGDARLLGSDEARPAPRPGGAPEQVWGLRTPPWPGDYRVRVHAYGRDDPSGESAAIWLWEAPAEPPRVHARADRLGHRLRGEPEPPPVHRPEAAYRWVQRSGLSVAATVTVVTGSSAAEVVRAFGADPGAPASLADLRSGAHGWEQMWLAVLDRGADVLVVEENGFTGSHGPVLSLASRSGRAASMFWNVNAVTRLSFAERGEVLGSCEPGLTPSPDHPAAAAAMADLDFANFRDKHEKGLVAVERFTGRGLTEDDLHRITEAGVAYLIPQWPG
ncbi:DUF6461 domain-containing protein [Actinokineospora bangkokensis]|uniref:Uncharacterized protein n=1 Tax=Actinokineospora bangkokensis TaxID=1193682 RepID=A0A1Q9LPB8_9PSEU|nr:DUF6461 domain-containing protein [Actinokineospora bangkokensis]OLR93870.1 hypothetical protein BJP25_14320 [Actinokineospora bangkokensis]